MAKVDHKKQWSEFKNHVTSPSDYRYECTWAEHNQYQKVNSILTFSGLMCKAQMHLIPLLLLGRHG